MKTPLKNLALAVTLFTVGLNGIQASVAQAGEGVLVAAVATMALSGTTVIGMAALGHPIKKPMVAEIAPDAMRFVTSNERSELLNSVLDETRQAISARGGDASKYSDEQLARLFVQVSIEAD